MKTFHINLFLCANFVATVFAYYKKCYDEFSVCLITNTYDDSSFRSKYKLIQLSADDWCKLNSASLAIITNETVQSAIEAFINDSSAKFNSDVITFAYRYNQSTWGWTDNTRADILVIGSYYGYGFMIQTISGTFYFSHDRLATSKRKFICSYLIYNFSCPDGHEQLGMRCYKINHQNVTWFDARNICLKEEGSDLATFEDGIPSLTSEWRDEYWIGLRRERWIWRNNGRFVDFKYSNWEDEQPSDRGDDCLCLKARTGKWTTCDCSQKNRYICIQDYASGSASTVTTSTTNITTTTTKPTTTTTKPTTTTTNMTTTVKKPTTTTKKMTTIVTKPTRSTKKMTTIVTKSTTTTKKMTTTVKKPTTTTTKMTTTVKKPTTTTTKQMTTQSTTATIPTVGDSSSQLHSTPTHTLDDYSRSTVSEDPPDTPNSWQSSDSQRLIIWVPLAVSIILIAVIVVFVSRMVIKKLRKRKRQGESSTTNTCQPASSADTYATLKPAEASIEDRTYAELTLYETIEDEKQKNSK